MATTKKKTTAAKAGGGDKSQTAGKRSTKSGATANRTQAKTTGKGKASEPDTGFIRTEAMIILSFALAVLLFLSNFHLCGAVGDLLRSVQLGVFGILGYVFPVALFVGSCFAASNRGNPAAHRKLAASVVIYLSLCTAAQLFFGSGAMAGSGILAFYQASAENGTGGGLIGGAISMGLQSLIGTVGTFLVLLVCLIISAVCITEKSIVGAVRKGSSAAYQYARDDMDRRREERRRMRDERVRGVDLEATDLSFGLPDQEEEDAGTEEYRDAGRKETMEEPVAKEPAALEAEPVSVSADRKDDIFTGSISPEPEEYVDEVPFEVDEERGPQLVGGLMATAEQLEERGLADSSRPTAAEEPEPWEETGRNPAVGEEPANEIFMDADAPEYEEAGMFSTPEETKRIVTAGGKIIELDTEALQKKSESMRTRWEDKGSSGEMSRTTTRVFAGGFSREAGETPASDENEGANVGEQIERQEEQPKKEYIFPPLSLLKKGTRVVGNQQAEEYRETAVKLQQTLRNFGVGVTVTNISCGPSVTRYELHPEQGVKVSKIVALADDIKLSLAAADIRIEAPIPGKSAVGIEVPNKENNTVYLRELLETDSFRMHTSNLAFAVGKDIGGQAVVTDIARMPHLLIAGATGSGKSVCINTIIMSIIYKAKPEDVRLIMVDPKVVELSVYNGIPHLLIPVVTDPKKASGALNWAVAEMTDRYKKFANYNVRDLKGYNAKVENIRDIEDEKKPKKLPQIVIIIDELADLMMVAPGEVEDAICRLAQLARACGIHLVIATQRPSVNVITGLIKANVPSRIAFAVSSGVDSRTIIDMNGAEKLLGKGDMLFYPAGFPKPQRVQGALVSDSEIQRVVDFLTEQGMTADYRSDIENQMTAAPVAVGGGNDNRDEYFSQAGRFIIENEKASIGFLQRKFKIGFNRAARIMDQLAEVGVVGEEEGTKPRKILMTMEEFEERMRSEGVE
ncbi:MAG: DNA translocase FtsK [Clostridiales bacterium]|nr:DNA translocase FtsK [Clostridiales bacterium]